MYIVFWVIWFTNRIFSVINWLFQVIWWIFSIFLCYPSSPRSPNVLQNLPYGMAGWSNFVEPWSSSTLSSSASSLSSSIQARDIRSQHERLSNTSATCNCDNRKYARKLQVMSSSSWLRELRLLSGQNQYFCSSFKNVILPNDIRVKISYWLSIQNDYNWSSFVQWLKNC